MSTTSSSTATPMEGIEQNPSTDSAGEAQTETVLTYHSSTKPMTVTIRGGQQDNTNTDIDTTQCHILKLPAELRLMIWEYYMPSIVLPRWRNARHCKKAGPIADRIPYRLPALLQTCKIFRFDAWELYLRALREHQAGIEGELRFRNDKRPKQWKIKRT